MFEVKNKDFIDKSDVFIVPIAADSKNVFFSW